MIELYYNLTNFDGEIIATNLPADLHKDIVLADDTITKCICSVRKIDKRHVYSKTPFGWVYLSTYNPEITRKIFQHYLNAFTVIVPLLSKNHKEVLASEKRLTRRLKHNLIGYNANILQQFYKLIPQQQLQGGLTNQKSVIKEVVEKQSDSTAYMLLQILKNATLMKSEFDVYDMLDGKSIPLDFHQHPIHKLTTLALVPFWLDLVENHININIGSSNEKVNVDYRSFSVALCHIFDNATKYAAPYSELNIAFKPAANILSIQFEMTSLKIEKYEIVKLLNEEYRGEWARKTDKPGAGIGLNVVNKLIQLNKGTFSIYVDTNPSFRKRVLDVPYERNIFEFAVQRV